MAFKTLGEIRADYLDPLLGLIDDEAEEPWGNQAVRNAAIINAFERLWPVMRKLVHRHPTVDPTLTDVDVEDLETVETIERVNTLGNTFAEIRNFRFYPDETEDPPLRRIILPRVVATTTETWRVTGYVRYIVPSGDDDDEECDFPTDRLFIITAGARAYLYLKRFNEYVDYARRLTQNLEAVTGLSELFAAYQGAEAEFQRGMTDNTPPIRLPRRARLTRSGRG